MADDAEKSNDETHTLKSERARREEEILAFWRKNRIFEKSLEKESPKGEFVFYDGPPFATGLPHYGSLLSSIIKDVIPRYKTMCGFHVRRRWGWDCHGLPIENIVEKQLGLATKKDIESLGIAAFNEAARRSVLQYVGEWKAYIDRVGRWVDFENSYKTMDNSYIESVWWGLKQIYDKGLLYEGRKVLLYCTRCETPLAKAEIAMDNSYKDVTEEAITMKFKLTLGQKIGDWVTDDNTYVLAWTTTPWTLPGNVALTVGEGIEYSRIHYTPQGISYFVASRVADAIFHGDTDYITMGKILGKSLVGLKYDPLYDIEKITVAGKPNTHTVLLADFVTTDEGTGIVHTAVMYGEDDYILGQREDLPHIQLLDAGGRFTDDAPEFLRGLFLKDAENFITNDLRGRGLLFDAESHTHSYPHCYRCGTPLIYNALMSWFLNVQKIKDRMIELNEEVNWYPEHLKHGRFKNIVVRAPDWTISRHRYWASPLPIWKNEKTGEITIIGSLDDLRRYARKSGNEYFVMRHGEAESNVRGILSTHADNPHHLTEAGKHDIVESATKLKSIGIGLIITSPFVRTKETALITAAELGLGADAVITDERIGEVRVGDFEGRSIEEYHAFFASLEERFTRPCGGGETYSEMQTRMGDFLYEIEKRYHGKKILIITHDAPGWMLFAAARGANQREAVALRGETAAFMKNAEVRALDFVPLPHNEQYELDLHRPYIDELNLESESGERLVRISDVVDCWIESASMPFAEYHYPFENGETFEKRSPGDFIAEYIAQTRTWFYYMHVLSVALFDRKSFRCAVTTGTILAEDGSKMSKSKGNYTDPMENLDHYGADSLRYCLMTSVVMHGEDLRFRDEDVREAHNRVINMLWNSYKFYEMYSANAESRGDNSFSDRAKMPEHVLDRWMRARVTRSVTRCTRYLDEFDTVHAGRELRSLVEDFSTWYIRRSRDRFRDGFLAMTFRETLETVAKLAAPILPFVAEDIYRGVYGSGESVHLADWPVATETPAHDDLMLLTAMEEVRHIASLGLEARMKAGLKVRQPLARLEVSSALWASGEEQKEEFVPLIADEVNVKEVVFSELLEENEVRLDTTVTPELQREGESREFVRQVQEARKKEGLRPGEKKALVVTTDRAGIEFLEAIREYVMRAAFLTDIKFEDASGEGTLIVCGESTLTISFC